MGRAASEPTCDKLLGPAQPWQPCPSCPLLVPVSAYVALALSRHTPSQHCLAQGPTQVSCACREMALGALQQDLAALLGAVQLLKDDNPGRKIAEIQGKLTTVPGLPPTQRGSGPKPRVSM